MIRGSISEVQLKRHTVPLLHGRSSSTDFISPTAAACSNTRSWDTNKQTNHPPSFTISNSTYPSAGHRGTSVVPGVGAFYLEAIRAVEREDVNLHGGEGLRAEHDVRRSRGGGELWRLAEDDVVEAIVVDVLRASKRVCKSIGSTTIQFGK